MSSQVDFHFEICKTIFIQNSDTFIPKMGKICSGLTQN